MFLSAFKKVKTVSVHPPEESNRQFSFNLSRFKVRQRQAEDGGGVGFQFFYLRLIFKKSNTYIITNSLIGY